MAKTRRLNSRALMAAVLLMASLTLSACTAEQFWRGVYEGGKKACQNTPSHCTDNAKGDKGRGY